MCKIEMFGKKMLDKIVNWMLIDEFKDEYLREEYGIDEEIKENTGWKTLFSQTSNLRSDEEKEASLISKELENNIEEGMRNYESISLDNRIDSYYEWYKVIALNNKGPKEDFINKRKNFINKVAHWYELRYPDYEINRLMPCTGQEPISVDNIMFKNNKYVIDKEAIKELKWADFYNKTAFINSLPFEERQLLNDPKYDDRYTIDIYNICELEYKDMEYLENCPYFIPGISIDENGIVTETYAIGLYTKEKILDSELIGMHIKDVLKLFKEREIKLHKSNDIEKIIRNYDLAVEAKERLLDCIMHTIIKNGGERIGPRRAFLFAKEFGRNIDVPIQYSVDLSDPGLRSFLHEYIKSGGDSDLECYNIKETWYNKKKVSTIITVKEILDIKNRPTKEEKELYQRLVTALNLGLDSTEIEKYKNQEIAKRKEEIKQKRIQRHIEKARMAKNS